MYLTQTTGPERFPTPPRSTQAETREATTPPGLRRAFSARGIPPALAPKRSRGAPWFPPHRAQSTLATLCPLNQLPRLKRAGRRHVAELRHQDKPILRVDRIPPSE